MCNHYHYVIPEHFHHASNPLAATFHLPPSQLVAAAKLLSVSMNLPILDVSYKWNHTLYGLLCLASFTQHDVLKVHHVVAGVRISFLLISFFKTRTCFSCLCSIINTVIYSGCPSGGGGGGVFTVDTVYTGQRRALVNAD